jgi:hypothetical protein
VGVVVAGLGLSGIATGSQADPKRAIESERGVEITDYDGHPHRTAPKRVGENLSLWCRSTTGETQVLQVGAYHDARQLRYRAFECPPASFPRHHHIVRLRDKGVYAMVISGAGFERLIIRTKVL